MTQANRRILAVFAHPDDETTSCGGAFARYASEGAEVFVATATRGEMGALGTGGLVISREELPNVREAELRAALKLLGVNPPILLGYIDGQLKDADSQQLVGKILSVMRQTRPDVVITWGPTGISSHDDHIAIHKAATEAFHRYRQESVSEPRLFYVAIPRDIAEQLEMKLHESETDISMIIDISAYKNLKIQALRGYKSQEDAQEVADLFENNPYDFEAFHQAYPPRSVGVAEVGL
ncbi:MAG: PIG-L family deacetylase [Chloroflexi bacterium]|nr:PIG-L family deacetylase [Chloroflexota bacterium]